MDHDTTAPRARQALDELRTQANEAEAEPITVDAANVLAALWTAAHRVGAQDAHILRWLNNSADLSALRRFLADRRGRGGRPPAVDLTAYETAPGHHRTAVREIITAALTRGAAR